MAKLEISADKLSDVIVEAIQDIKGEEIVKLDLREIENSIAQFFIICSGGSSTHVTSIAGSVEKDVSKTVQEKPWKVEGIENAEWVLLDYGNVVLHVFQRPVREFYKLEDLWADAERTLYEEELN